MQGLPVTAVTAKARASIMALQDMMLRLPEQVTYQVRHYFSDGWYMREITIPAHQVVVGKIHKHAHQNCISAGLVRVFTEAGYDEMAAPFMFVSEPGTKRVVLTLEDTVWTTYHHNPTNTRDLAAIEAAVIASDYKELDNVMGNGGNGRSLGCTGDGRGA
jgi:hypothetical protein